MFSTVNFSTIKGLMPAFPELGRIKIGQLGEERTSKGGTKFRLPQKLDHFRVTQRVRGADGQFLLDEEVHKVVGAQPTELSVLLIYDDPALNCPSRLNCYQGTRRWCHGNGEQALRMDAKGIYQARECPCPLLMAPDQAPENSGKTEFQMIKCKPNGSLGVQLPYKQSSVGVYRFRTTSMESIQSILTVQGAVLLRTGGILAGIPLRLRLYPATDNTPGGASRSWKVTLDLPLGGWEEVEETARQIMQQRMTSRLSMKAIEARARQQMKALGSGTAEADALIDELFPKPITVVDGVEVLDADPDTEAPEPPAEPPPPPAPPPPPEAVPPEPGAQPGLPMATPETREPDADEMRFMTAFDAERAAGTEPVEAEAVALQIKVLERLITRKAYVVSRMKKPLEQFSRDERRGFAKYLLAMPDAPGFAGDKNPWD